MPRLIRVCVCVYGSARDDNPPSGTAAAAPPDGADVQKKKYGLLEKIIDGLRIEIDSIRVSLATMGKYKTDERGSWTPPTLVLEVKHFCYYSTDENWKV